MKNMEQRGDTVERKRHIWFFCLMLCMLMSILPGCEEMNPTAREGTIAVHAPEGNEVVVHFIDVGQADCTLIMAGEHAMLVDAGNNDDGAFVVEYLKKQGVEKLDYLIGTHPHEDHIGGLDTVIESFAIDKTIMPLKETTTKTFQDVLAAMINKGYTLTKPTPGEVHHMGALSFCVLAPLRDYGDELNNWSVGLYLWDEKHSMVMCGDAEQEAEEEMVKTFGTLTADILKVGHHGSSTSTCDAFLRAVNPSYAVIPVGIANDYGHPHRETLQALRARNIEIFRTDRHGSIVCVWNDNITWMVERTGEQERKQYVLNTKSKVYHLPTCENIADMSEKNKKNYKATNDELEAMGYFPCGGCRP